MNLIQIRNRAIFFFFIFLGFFFISWGVGFLDTIYSSSEVSDVYIYTKRLALPIGITALIACLGFLLFVGFDNSNSIRNKEAKVQGKGIEKPDDMQEISYKKRITASICVALSLAVLMLLPSFFWGLPFNWIVAIAFILTSTQRFVSNIKELLPLFGMWLVIVSMFMFLSRKYNFIGFDAYPNKYFLLMMMWYVCAAFVTIWAIKKYYLNKDNGTRHSN